MLPLKRNLAINIERYTLLSCYHMLSIFAGLHGIGRRSIFAAMSENLIWSDWTEKKCILALSLEKDVHCFTWSDIIWSIISPSLLWLLWLRQRCSSHSGTWKWKHDGKIVLPVSPQVYWRQRWGLPSGWWLVAGDPPDGGCHLADGWLVAGDPQRWGLPSGWWLVLVVGWLPCGWAYYCMNRSVPFWSHQCIRKGLAKVAGLCAFTILRQS